MNSHYQNLYGKSVAGPGAFVIIAAQMAADESNSAANNEITMDHWSWILA